MFLKTDILEQSSGFYFVKSFFGVEIMQIPIRTGWDPKDAFECTGEMKLVVVSHRTSDFRNGNPAALQKFGRFDQAILDEKLLWGLTKHH